MIAIYPPHAQQLPSFKQKFWLKTYLIYNTTETKFKSGESAS